MLIKIKTKEDIERIGRAQADWVHRMDFWFGKTITITDIDYAMLLDGYDLIFDDFSWRPCCFYLNKKSDKLVELLCSK